MASQRLDQALTERGLCPSREKAQRAIMAGQVTLNGQKAEKASQKVHPEDQIEILAPERFVSRGGHKLEQALQEFAVKAEGCVAVDFGASTGGFTDCLLQHGARLVYAVDVGQGQLAWKLRQDARVRVHEKTNARHLLPGGLGADFVGADLVVIDCSFISLRQVLPPAIALLKPSGKIVALIKPQFEAGKAEVNKGEGVISDPLIHARVLEELQAFVAGLSGVEWKHWTESPLLGPAGNKEFLVLIEKKG